MDSRVVELISQLQLELHPEGGFFRRNYASAVQVEYRGQSRPALTAIHFLLIDGQVSQWHRVDADECWHWQEGDALELLVFDPEEAVLTTTVLDGSGRGDGVPMHVVPAGYWQAARPRGAYTLVACTVSPGFLWTGFELLQDDDTLVPVLEQAGGLPL